MARSRLNAEEESRVIASYHGEFNDVRRRYDDYYNTGSRLFVLLASRRHH